MTKEPEITKEQKKEIDEALAKLNKEYDISEWK